MNKTYIQEVLPFVEMPSRYLGGEANSIQKDLSRVDLRFALAFPDLYEIGTSHFGMQILYTILNRKQNIAAERFFTPAPDMETLLKKKGIPLLSLESQTDLKQFDIIGFSLLYELNFTNILTMLDLSGIPFHADQRDDSFPLVIGGGPCTFNPEPLAEFFDAMVTGDGEKTVIELSDTFIQWKKQGDGRKKTLLKLWSEIQGVYIPSFFTPRFDDQSIQHLEPNPGQAATIKRAILNDLAAAPFPTSPVVPFGKPVHDRLRLEIARGCSRGCRFCQAGMIYRPVRERSVSDLVTIAEQTLKATGYSDISLLSLSTGDYGNLEQLMESLLHIVPDHCTAISLPSVRAGKLTPELMNIIRKVKKTGFTIAPEAGTQRLRDVINKNITESDIFDTVTNAFNLGWRNIKLYFMNGLPTETDKDIEGICDLSKRLAGVKIKGKGKSRINVSFAPFIPKPHTPFQRHTQITVQKARENLNYLKQNLRHPGINLKWHDPEMSLLEGVWSRGDRKLSRLLVAAWEKGCRLDGWSDMFRPDLWEEAFSDTGIDPQFYTTRPRQENEPLPWNHIDPGISDEFLDKELKKAMTCETTADCRDNECTGCGICDFKTIQPVLHDKTDNPGIFTAPSETDPIKDELFTRFRLFYSRLGNARHFGHLELAKIMRRAIRRTGIKVKYSKGFNPSMKLSFDNPLPVGMESQEEFCTLHTRMNCNPEDLVEKMNQVLPESITITACIPVAKLPKNALTDHSTYRILLKDHAIDKSLAASFMDRTEYIVEQTNFKGKTRKTDLRKGTKRIDFLDSNHIEMVLTKYQERTIRPADILTIILNVPENAVQTAEILKLKQGMPPC